MLNPSLRDPLPAADMADLGFRISDLGVEIDAIGLYLCGGGDPAHARRELVSARNRLTNLIADLDAARAASGEDR